MANSSTPIHADPFPGKAVVVYDGDCPLCRKSVGILRRLDWLGRLAYQPVRDADRLPPTIMPLDPRRLLEEMHVLTPDRRHAYAGYRAIRWLAWQLPPLWPVAPLACLPGLPQLGRRAYRWVAKNRYDLLPCDDGKCHTAAH
jgi:predicted DCC family thiol-disulfide oxidoreductase YuxK